MSDVPKPDETRKLLEDSKGPIEFSDLRAHITRGAVITVSPTLDLMDVGEALAKDDKSKVAAWIEAGQIGKPSIEQLERWSKTEGPIATSLVVQPFVLVQEAASTTAN